MVFLYHVIHLLLILFLASHFLFYLVLLFQIHLIYHLYNQLIGKIPVKILFFLMYHYYFHL